MSKFIGWAAGKAAGMVAGPLAEAVLNTNTAQQLLDVAKTGAANAAEKVLSPTGEVIERKWWRGPDNGGMDIQDVRATLRHTTVKNGSLAFAYTSSSLDITGAKFKNMNMAGAILMMAYTCEWEKKRVFSPHVTRKILQPNEGQPYYMRPIISFADALPWLKSALETINAGEAGVGELAKWSPTVRCEVNPLYFLGRIIASGRYLQQQEIADYPAKELAVDITTFNQLADDLLVKAPELVPYANPLALDVSMKVTSYGPIKLIEDYQPKTFQQKLDEARARENEAEKRASEAETHVKVVEERERAAQAELKMAQEREQAANARAKEADERRTKVEEELAKREAAQQAQQQQKPGTGKRSGNKGAGR